MQSQVFSRGLALLVALAGFMELFDGTVIQTALPRMAADFQVSSGTASIAMAAYFAAAAGAIPVCAWLTARCGAKSTLAVSFLLFGLTSLGCGAAPSFTWLIALRVLQGLSGAVMMTVGQIVILQNAPKEKLLNVTAYLVWPALAAPVLAPVVGGFITDNLGWQWLFWVNVPLTVVAAAAALRLAPGLAAQEVKPRLDVVGAALLAVGVCTLIPALGLSGQGGSVARSIAVAIGLAGLLGAVIWLRRAKSPLLDLNIFAIQTFRATNTAGVLYRAVIASVPVVLTLLFQLKFGFTATLAGLVIMALFVGNLSIKPFANFLVRRRGYPFTIFWSTAVGVAVLVAFAMLNRDVSLWLLLPLLYVSGAARSVGFTAYMSMQYVDVPKAQMPQASPLSGTTQQLATAFGIAGFMWILAVSSGDYRVTLIAMALVLLVSALMARRLPSTAGQAARG